MLFIERWLPIIIALITGALSYICRFNLSNIKDYKFLFSNIVSFTSIIMGFLGTMVSILITLTSKRVMKAIKAKKADKLLAEYFIWPIFSGMILAIYSIILAIFFDDVTCNESNEIMALIISALWVVNAVLFVGVTIRIFLVMLKLLGAVYEEDTEPERTRTEADKSKVIFNTEK